MSEIDVIEPWHGQKRLAKQQKCFFSRGRNTGEDFDVPQWLNRRIGCFFCG